MRTCGGRGQTNCPVQQVKKLTLVFFVLVLAIFDAKLQMGKKRDYTP